MSIRNALLHRFGIASAGREAEIVKAVSAFTSGKSGVVGFGPIVGDAAAELSAVTAHDQKASLVGENHFCGQGVFLIQREIKVDEREQFPGRFSVIVEVMPEIYAAVINHNFEVFVVDGPQLAMRL